MIKDTPQVLKRVSVRWPPDSAYEDSVTIALNVGGWFMDLRVATADGSLQWSRAGERKTLRQEPCTLSFMLEQHDCAPVINTDGIAQ